MELVDVNLAIMLLGLALLFKDLDGLVEGLDGCPFHLQLLESVRLQNGKHLFHNKGYIVTENVN